jgi:thiol-disulfide isomerase/thioredoxin
MKSNSDLAKKVLLGIALLGVMGLLGLATARAETPLSKDDVTLLLLGASPSDKIIQTVQERGIDFKMSPDLAKKFHDLGASDDLIEALQKAGNKFAATAPSVPPAEGKPNATETPASPGTAGISPSAPQTTTEAKPLAAAPAQTPSDATVEQKIQEILAGLASGPSPDAGAREPGMEAPKAPILRIQDISGRRLTPEDFKDKVVLINFWATWCPYCKREIPALVRLQDRYREEGLQVVGIAVEDSSHRVKEFAKENGINYPVAMGDETLKRIYGGVSGLPTSFLIGRDGRIYQKIAGAPMDMSVFEQSIKMLVKATPAKGTPVAQASAPAASPAESSSEPTLHVRNSATQSQPQTPAAPAQASAPPASPAESSSEPTLHVRNSAAQSQPQTPGAPAQAKRAAPANPATASAANLKDPNPEEIRRVIQEFAAKEKVFREARNNYTYHQINKVQELGPDNEVVGTYQQEWDILYDDNGKRIQRVTYAPEPTLKGLIVTKEDIENFENIQPFVLTTDELPEYEVKYLGHVQVDQITAYVFDVRPKQIEKNRLYFKGVVWVDDRDLQIVKSEGKTVPELKSSKGNLFPRFSTWREQIDGKFWFPTYTSADDTLYFPNGPPVHMKETVRYTDYKQFKSGTRIVNVEAIDKQKEPATPPPAAPRK